jgi:hypothetical protein
MYTRYYIATQSIHHGVVSFSFIFLPTIPRGMTEAPHNLQSSRAAFEVKTKSFVSKAAAANPTKLENGTQIIERKAQNNNHISLSWATIGMGR